MTERSSVHGHVILGTCAEGTQLWQFQYGEPLQKKSRVSCYSEMFRACFVHGKRLGA
jgi:hypothetical protein